MELLFCSHTATLLIRVHDSDILLCDEKYTFYRGSAFLPWTESNDWGGLLIFFSFGLNSRNLFLIVVEAEQSKIRVFSDSMVGEDLLLDLWKSIFLPWTSLVAQMVTNLPAKQEVGVQSLGWDESLEKGMATHSSILAWRIPQSTGSERIRHNWVTNTFTFHLFTVFSHGRERNHLFLVN